MFLRMEVRLAVMSWFGPQKPGRTTLLDKASSGT
jgi:hypothetical protein